MKIPKNHSKANWHWKSFYFYFKKQFSTLHVSFYRKSTCLLTQCLQSNIKMLYTNNTSLCVGSKISTMKLLEKLFHCWNNFISLFSIHFLLVPAKQRVSIWIICSVRNLHVVLFAKAVYEIVVCVCGHISKQEKFCFVINSIFNFLSLGLCSNL